MLWSVFRSLVAALNHESRSKDPIPFILMLLYLAVMITLFLDHFPWTTEQGQLMMWGVMGMGLGINKLKV
jgi:hypothetical protein